MSRCSAKALAALFTIAAGCDGSCLIWEVGPTPCAGDAEPECPDDHSCDPVSLTCVPNAAQGEGEGDGDGAACPLYFEHFDGSAVDVSDEGWPLSFDGDEDGAAGFSIVERRLRLDISGAPGIYSGIRAPVQRDGNVMISARLVTPPSGPGAETFLLVEPPEEEQPRPHGFRILDGTLEFLESGDINAAVPFDVDAHRVLRIRFDAELVYEGSGDDINFVTLHTAPMPANLDPLFSVSVLGGSEAATAPAVAEWDDVIIELSSCIGCVPLFIDHFDDGDLASQWVGVDATAGAVSASDGALELLLAPGGNDTLVYVSSAPGNNIVNHTATLRIVVPPPPGAQLFFAINNEGIMISDGSLVAFSDSAQLATAAYVPEDAPYLRIRISDGDEHFETSRDGSDFAEFATTPMNDQLIDSFFAVAAGSPSPQPGELRVVVDDLIVRPICP